MNRIDKTFAALKERKKKGFVAFLTAGDPDPEQSERDIREALDNGVDVLELGIPFSDPTADGGTIQEASQRALKSGMTLRRALDLVRRIRADYETPIVIFGYANLFFRYGYVALCEEAAAAGADGFLVVDLPFEESGELREHLDRNGLHFIMLAAPTTGPERLRQILTKAGGFVYYIMVTGVTGVRASLAVDLAARMRQLRSATTLPVAVGFGVSSGAQAAEAAREADAVVVGSALIAAARKNQLGALVREIRQGLDKGDL